MGDDRIVERTTDQVVVDRDGYDPDDHSKELAGAAAGAVGGAVVGSVVPGIGTAVGAVAGGAAGAIAGKADEMNDDDVVERTTQSRYASGTTDRVVVDRDGYDPDDHSKELAGAAIGAAGGAVVGSVVPGIGTAVGAVVGGAAGAIAGKADEMNDDDEVVVERTTHTR